MISLSNVSFSDKIVQDGFIDGFANALARMGNVVRCYVLRLEKTAEKDLKAFKPDLIISFNNVMMNKSLLSALSCPICVFGYDSVSFWNDLDLIKANYDRYYLIHHGDDTYSQAMKLFPGMPKSHHFIFGYASDLRKKDLVQDIEISFIGGLGNWHRSLQNYFIHRYHGQKNLSLNEIKDKVIEDIETTSEKHLTIIKNSPEYWDQLNLMDYRQAIILNATTLKRFEILRNLTDLGLKVFSYPQFIDVISWDLGLAKAFDFTPSVSLEDSEYNFNRSKISLNLPHAHAQNGFSCRVCAIMASNACLLSDYRRDLKLLMQSYITMPMFESAAEARDLAQKLLVDNVWRKDVVAASQQMVEDHCRFEKKIKEMETWIGVPLDNKDIAGRKEFYLNKYTGKNHLNWKDKIRYKIWKHLNKKLKKENIIL